MSEILSDSTNLNYGNLLRDVLDVGTKLQKVHQDRERMSELKVSTAELARRAGLSETTIRYLGITKEQVSALAETLNAVTRARRAAC